ncbi:unnamed protein product, partial [Schistosoma turkestanicum]
MHSFNFPPLLRNYCFGTRMSVFSNRLKKVLKYKLVVGTSCALCGYVGFLLLTDNEYIPEYYPRHLTVSPVDGKVLHCGPIDSKNAVLEQIKGIYYSLDEFLGPMGNIESLTGKTSDRSLYQCVIYLAPGDYHRFHSPVEWIPTVRRHFPGRLLSVRPNIAGRLPGLYTINERVVYLGEWNYGLMSFAAVGAFGVGNIHVNIDPTLITNKKEDNALRFRSSNTPTIIN